MSENNEMRQEQPTEQRTKSTRGFASMSQDQQREIASKGGRAAHRLGTAHKFTSEEAREAGRKGGRRSSKGKEKNQDTTTSQENP